MSWRRCCSFSRAAWRQLLPSRRRPAIAYFTGWDNRIHRITVAGEQSVFAGDGKMCVGMQACAGSCPTPEPDPCDADGPGPSARFLRPRRIEADRTGALYVVDSPTYQINYRLRKIQ